MNNLKILRKEIDRIDNEILDLLSRRLKIVKNISTVKKKSDKQIFDQFREDEVKKNWFSKAELLDMESRNILRILDEVLKMSKETQLKMIK